ncbi:COX15 [Malassezia furfur]|nr:COX15 [Malassezia furfur]
MAFFGARAVCQPLLRNPGALFRSASCARPSLLPVRTLSSATRSSLVPRTPLSRLLPTRPVPCAQPVVRAPRYNLLRTYATAAAPEPQLATRPIVAYHLLFSAALVFLIIVVGGITRLTESGLSITEWNPGLKGMRLPSSDAEWNAEWDKYKESPEINQDMTLEDFKMIFMWEWSHRILGRVIGVFFGLPALYFCMRRGVATPDVRWKLLAITAGIGFQGLLGWIMVASGLKDPYENEPANAQPRPEWTPRVSHFKLAAHLSTAFAVYMGMLYTAVNILRDNTLASAARAGAAPERQALLGKVLAQLQSPAVRKYRRVAIGLLGLVFTTAVYGAFVAGLDAGLVYSEFPTMGEGRLLPPKSELLDARYAVRTSEPVPSPDVTREPAQPTFSRMWLGNLTQNPVTVQAVHRFLGITTLLSMFGFLRYTKKVKALLPPGTKRFATGAAHMTVLQVLLGISTLIYMVPVPLAATHQAGSVVVLTFMTCVLGVLRKPNQALRAFAQARAASKVQA